MNDRLWRPLAGMAGLYVTAGLAAGLFLRWYRPWPPGTDLRFTAAAVALPLALALGYLMGSIRHFQEERLVRAGMGQPRFEDGRRVVAIGPIEVLGPALLSPFTRRECAAYQYQIEHDSRDAGGGLTVVRDYWGMALTPCQIRTPAGPVRILGAALLEQEAQEPRGHSYRAASDYLHAATFRHPSGGGDRLGPAAPDASEADTFREDVCADLGHIHERRDSEGELRQLRLVERRVEVGAAVCAAGIYSARKQALVPTRRGVKGLRLTTYGPERWAEENRRWGRIYVRWGLFFLALAAVAALGTRWLTF